jgi:hypothetical protein
MTCLNIPPMSFQRKGRAIVALAAAYALALQATLLAFGGPAAGTAGFAAVLLCVHGAGLKCGRHRILEGSPQPIKPL